MMKLWMTRGLCLTVLSGMTSGCIMYRLEELRNTTPSGSPFQSELSRLYLDFATREEKAYDWQDSWYFADKGLQLAYGRDAGPEELDSWNISGDARMELEKARIRVTDALTPQLKAASPSKAAAIQFYFDCWVEEQEEGWQTDDIGYCRDNLIHALGDSTVYDTPVPRMKAGAAPLRESRVVEASPRSVMPAKPAEKAARPRKEVMAETSSYAVFFESGQAEISVPGRNVLGEVISAVKGRGDFVVVLHVAAGAQEKDLPARRMSVVKQALTEGGVSESAIVSADTPEAARSAARRIELFLNE